MMATLTLELPEDLYQKVTAVPEAERNNFAVSLLRNGISFVTDGNDVDDISDADLADAAQKIRIGLAEFEAEQSLSLEEANAQSLARFDQRFADAG